MGNSRTSFLATTIGLVANIILDPVFIFGIGIFPSMGVMGALRIATVIAQAVVMLVFLIVLAKDELIFKKLKIFKKPDYDSLKQIIQIGFPRTGIQSMIFTGISMIIARMIAGFGDTAVAVQKVGSQIESISWMTAEGFAAAGKFFCRPKFRSKERYACSQRLPCFHGNCIDLGCRLYNVINRPARSYLRDFHSGSFDSSNGNFLPANTWFFSTIHVY